MTFAQFKIGPKAGLNLAFLVDGEDIEPGTKEPFLPVFNAGIAAELEMNELSSFYGEIIFTQKGQKIVSENNSDMFQSFIMNFVEVPLLLRLKIGTETFKIYANAGPTFGYWFGGKVKSGGFEPLFEDGTSDIVFLEEGEIPGTDEIGILEDNINHFEIGVAGGLGILLDAGPGDLQASLRYNLSLIDLDTQDGETQKIFPHVVSVNLAYLFNLGDM